MNKKIGIVGSRDRDDKPTFDLIKEKFIMIYNPGDWIISGGCKKGGDRIANDLAQLYGLPILNFYPANLYTHIEDADGKKYFQENSYFEIGPFFERNTPIANVSDYLIATPKPDTVKMWNKGLGYFIPYIAKAKGGSEDTIRKYLKLGKADLIIL